MESVLFKDHRFWKAWNSTSGSSHSTAERAGTIIASTSSMFQPIEWGFPCALIFEILTMAILKPAVIPHSISTLHLTGTIIPRHFFRE